MDKLKNLLSRKFLIAVLGVIGGVAVAMTGLGGKIGTIAGSVAAGVSLLTYIITEGVIDASSIKSAVKIAKDIEKEIEDTEKPLIDIDDKE